MEQITGKREEVGEKETVRHKSKVLEWIQSSPLPEGPCFVHHPTLKPLGGEAGRRVPVFIANLSTLSICPVNTGYKQPGRCPLKIRRRGPTGALEFWVHSASLQAVGSAHVLWIQEAWRPLLGHPRAGSWLVLVGEGLSPRRHLSLLSVLKLFSALRFDPSPRAKSGHQSREGQGQSRDGGGA